MTRCFAAVLALWISPMVRADVFDTYFNADLVKISTAPGVIKVKELTKEMMVSHSRVLPGITACFIVVKNNHDRYSKLLILPARQKVSKTESAPILLIERYVTYEEGEDRVLQAQGKNVRLFSGFHFNLDLGQVVPASVPSDLQYLDAEEKSGLHPVGKAEIYLVTKPLPAPPAKKDGAVVIGPNFEPAYFKGTFKLHDDGRRSGDLNLKVDDDGVVTGHYFSDKDGQKYEVTGKVGDPPHTIQFRIQFPRTIQFFQGLMFTGDGKAITGSSKLQERETGFYAVRVE